jgi:hypothetical protein
MGIPAIKKPVKDYPLAGFHDYLFFPVTWGQARFALPGLADSPSGLDFRLAPNRGADARFPWDSPPSVLGGALLNLDTMKAEQVALVPMGCRDAILRRMTFPAAQ